jgi:hypothetical protein
LSFSCLIVNSLKAIIVYPINLLSRISSYYRSMLDKKNKKYLPGADPGFQVRGDLKKLRRAEGGAKMLGYFVWQIKILCQKIFLFSNFRGWGGARAGCAPHGSAPAYIHIEDVVHNFSFVHPCWSGVYFSKPVICKSQKY